MKKKLDINMKNERNFSSLFSVPSPEWEFPYPWSHLCTKFNQSKHAQVKFTLKKITG